MGGRKSWVGWVGRLTTRIREVQVLGVLNPGLCRREAAARALQHQLKDGTASAESATRGVPHRNFRPDGAQWAAWLRQAGPGRPKRPKTRGLASPWLGSPLVRVVLQSLRAPSRPPRSFRRWRSDPLPSSLVLGSSSSSPLICPPPESAWDALSCPMLVGEGQSPALLRPLCASGEKKTTNDLMALAASLCVRESVCAWQPGSAVPGCGANDRRGIAAGRWAS